MDADVKAPPFRILACIANTPRADRIAGAARLWAEWLDADLSFLHVADSPRHGSGWPLSQHGPEILHDRPFVSEYGRPDRVICNQAKLLSADLIILGALEQDTLVTSILGSVARRVARRAECSVLLLTNPDGGVIQRIVSSVGMDAKSSAMLQFVLDLARRVPVEQLFVIHEYDSYTGMLRILGEQQRGAEEHHARAARDESTHLAEFLSEFDLEGINYCSECLDGHIGQEAVEFVLRHQADLLTLPSPERLSFWDRFFQHPSETALQRLPSSLLLHRSRKDQTT